MSLRSPKLLLGVEQALFAQALQSVLEPRFQIVGIAAGAGALLLESSGPEELVFAVEEALAGLPYVTPGATRALLDALPAGTVAAGEPPLRC